MTWRSRRTERKSFTSVKRSGGRALPRARSGGPRAPADLSTELPSDFDNANLLFVGRSVNRLQVSPGKGILRVAVAGGPPVKIADDNIPALSAARGAGRQRGPCDGDPIPGYTEHRRSGGGSLELTSRWTSPELASSTWRLRCCLPARRSLFCILGHRSNNWRPSLFSIPRGAQAEDARRGAGPTLSMSPSGHLVFARGTTLMAVAFDPNRLEVSRARPGPCCPVCDTLASSRPQTSVCLGPAR